MKTNNSNILHTVYLAGNIENKIIIINKTGQKFKRNGRNIGFLARIRYNEEKKIREKIYQAPIVKNAYSDIKERKHIRMSKIINIK